MKTTLNKIRDRSPCKDSWEKLLKSLNKTGPDDEPLDLLTILDSNGLDDTLWCLRAVEGHEKEIRLYAVWCARQVQHLMKDDRSIEALDIAENYANGLASEKELAAAWSAANAAWAAAWSAANAARAATWAATSAAASAAAWDATSAATSAATAGVCTPDSTFDCVTSAPLEIESDQNQNIQFIQELRPIWKKLDIWKK